MSASLLCEKAYQITNAKTYVFSVSVLCVGKMGDDPLATWKSKIKRSSENNHFKDMNRIDGMLTEFEWKIFPRIQKLGLLEKIKSLMTDLHCEPENCKDRIIFIQCTTTWNGKQKETLNNVNTIHRQLRIMLANSIAVFFDAWIRRKMVRDLHLQTRWILGSNGREMMLNFSGSGHPIFRASRAFERGGLRNKKVRKKSIHCNGRTETIELRLRTVISANQLSVYGAVSDLCDEVPKVVWALGKLAAPDHLEKMDIPTDLSIAEILPMHSNGET